MLLPYTIAAPPHPDDTERKLKRKKKVINTSTKTTPLSKQEAECYIHVPTFLWYLLSITSTALTNCFVCLSYSSWSSQTPVFAVSPAQLCLMLAASQIWEELANMTYGKCSPVPHIPPPSPSNSNTAPSILQLQRITGQHV